MELVNYLFDYLKGNELLSSFMTPAYIIKDTNVSYYYTSENYLEVGTSNSEMYVDLTDFSRLTFDAIVCDATTKEELQELFPKLEQITQYNIYLENSKGEVLFHILRVHKQNQH